jgi:hypothetical protein
MSSSADTKQVVFAGDADDRYDLDTLATVKALLDIKVYAFCLVSSHVHLVVQPGDAIAELGGLVKHLAGRQTGLVNRQAACRGMLLGRTLQMSLSRSPSIRARSSSVSVAQRT